MSQQSLRSARITGTGRYCPERILTNFDLEKMVETTDEWITTRTGIKERHIADEKEACSDLCYHAARSALDMAGFHPQDLDGIFVGTVTGDTQFPASAVFVQDRLGATHAAAMDLSAACSGSFLRAALLSSAVDGKQASIREARSGTSIRGRSGEGADRAHQTHGRGDTSAPACERRRAGARWSAGQILLERQVCFDING